VPPLDELVNAEFRQKYMLGDNAQLGVTVLDNLKAAEQLKPIGIGPFLQNK